MNVLISLHRGYGLGDAVCMSAVLRHIVRYRPYWRVDYQAEEGRHQVARGIVTNHFTRGREYPSKNYDTEIQFCLYDRWVPHADRPSTLVSQCLHELGLPWTPDLGRYQVSVRDESVMRAKTLIYGYNGGRHPGYIRKTPCVAIHYQGDSAKAQKDLSHYQAEDICHAVSDLGFDPLILDWRNQSNLLYRRLVNPSDWGSDAEMTCAVISQCAAFIGIDSGPAKCASATDVPALVVWTNHHPAQFHDPAPNTTHLVPRGYHDLMPVCSDPGVVKFFEENYVTREYNRDPVAEVSRWLKEVLKC